MAPSLYTKKDYHGRTLMKQYPTTPAGFGETDCIFFANTETKSTEIIPRTSVDDVLLKTLIPSFAAALLHGKRTTTRTRTVWFIAHENSNILTVNLGHRDFGDKLLGSMIVREPPAAGEPATAVYDSSGTMEVMTKRSKTPNVDTINLLRQTVHDAAIDIAWAWLALYGHTSGPDSVPYASPLW